MDDFRDHKDQMAQIDEAHRRAGRETYDRWLIERTLEQEPRWENALGEEVDLDDIDREYALNILMMAHARRVTLGYTYEDFIADPLLQKLRDVVLNGREPDYRDRQRAKRYNNICEVKGLPWRAMFRDLHKDV